MQLSEREVLYLKDSLDAETTLIQKFGAFAAQATDPEVKRMCREIQENHRVHHQQLTQHITAAAGRTAGGEAGGGGTGGGGAGGRQNR